MVSLQKGKSGDILTYGEKYHVNMEVANDKPTRNAGYKSPTALRKYNLCQHSNSNF